MTSPSRRSDRPARVSAPPPCGYRTGVIEVRPGRPGWSEVTFGHRSDAAELAVVGDFNQWAAGATPLTGDDDGARRTTLAIPVGRTYRFRYLLDRHRWEHDADVDERVANDVGGEDSVLDLRHDGPHADRLGIGDPRAIRRQQQADVPVSPP